MSRLVSTRPAAQSPPLRGEASVRPRPRWLQASEPVAVPSTSCGECGERREVRQEEEVRRLVTECYIHPEDTARITVLGSRFLESVCSRIQETKPKIF